MGDKLVCVGGPADGGSCSVEDSQRTVQRLVRRETSWRYNWGGEMPDEVVKIETAEYRREKLYVDGKEIEFLVYAPMSMFDAVKKLLEDHRP
jgi:hypothetical protein